MSQMYFKNGSSWVNAVNIFWPVGAIYMSQNGTSPASLFGGGWQQMSDYFPRFNWTAGGKGGEANHTLTENEMPWHHHPLSIKGSWQEATNFGLWSNPQGFKDRIIVNNGGNTTWGAYNQGDVVSYQQGKGGGASHNNIPPFLDCCAWYRVS